MGTGSDNWLEAPDRRQQREDRNLRLPGNRTEHGAPGRLILWGGVIQARVTWPEEAGAHVACVMPSLSPRSALHTSPSPPSPCSQNRGPTAASLWRPHARTRLELGTQVPWLGLPTSLASPAPGGPRVCGCAAHTAHVPAGPPSPHPPPAPPTSACHKQALSSLPFGA